VRLISTVIIISLLSTIGLKSLQERGITAMEISVAEAPLQMAIYSADLPLDEAALLVIQTSPKFRPRPCLSDGDDAGEES
jgi:hypothetical protein